MKPCLTKLGLRAQVVFENEKMNAKMESHLEKNGESCFPKKSVEN